MVRLHRGGRFRSWLGHGLGGGPELGDRIWRRILHGLGAGALLYYVLPPNVLWVVPNVVIPFLALAIVLAIEAMRLGGAIEVPVIRPYEARRPASYAYFAIAIVIAIVAFPQAIAIAVVLGTAIVDPLAGELRGAARPTTRRWYPWAPFVVYVALAWTALFSVGHWNPGFAAAISIAAGVAAILTEAPKWKYVDDDLAMTLVPGTIAFVLAALLPGLI
ncbi:MAG: hypothetical protein ACREBT_01160 [Thermoplasmata archaeon]